MAEDGGPEWARDHCDICNGAGKIRVVVGPGGRYKTKTCPVCIENRRGIGGSGW